MTGHLGKKKKVYKRVCNVVEIRVILLQRILSLIVVWARINHMN